LYHKEADMKGAKKSAGESEKSSNLRGQKKREVMGGNSERIWKKMKAANGKQKERR